MRWVGVPMIIAGVFAPLMGPVIGLGALKGKCPWCGARISSLRSHQSFDCAACHQRIAVHDLKFVRVA